ncbi:MAG: hypothetical protein J6R35_04120 [Clostridia bacterium]|nr:hypothetical protein [Clostridia bacterium]
MKRLAILILVLSIVLSASIGGAIAYNALNKDTTPDNQDDNKIDFAWDKVRVAKDYMYPDNFEYVDYAEEVKFDYDKHPLLLDQGFFWCKYDEAQNEVIKVDADSEEGAALVDPNKPTIINIHGMTDSGGHSEEMYWWPSRNGTLDQVGYETPIQMLQFWLDRGYNVGMYSYNRFAAESGAFFNIEEKMWTTEGSVGIRYATPEDTYVEDASEFTVAEHFAAEWIRATNILPEGFGNQDIRFAAHSMGGPVVLAGSFLLTELASVGQIDTNLLPDRICLQDTYFGTFFPMGGDEFMNLGYENQLCRWSNKNISSPGEAAVEAIKDIAANNIVIEYYTYAASSLWMWHKPAMRKAVLENSVTFMLTPDFVSITDQHCGVREFYMISILYDYEATENATNAEKSKYYASIPTAVLKEMVGKYFAMTAGGPTVLSPDDALIEEDIYTVVDKLTVA